MIVFSDVEVKNFQFAPSFFDRRQFGREPLTFPDRVRLTVEALKSGKHMMFLGGWFSFNGEMGKEAGVALNCERSCGSNTWNTRIFGKAPRAGGRSCAHRTPDCTGGTAGSDFADSGYNRVRPRERCDVVAVWSGTSDPMIATGVFGKGRVLRIRLILRRTGDVILFTEISTRCSGTASCSGS